MQEQGQCPFGALLWRLDMEQSSRSDNLCYIKEEMRNILTNYSKNGHGYKQTYYRGRSEVRFMDIVVHLKIGTKTQTRLFFLQTLLTNSFFSCYSFHYFYATYKLYKLNTIDDSLEYTETGMKLFYELDMFFYNLDTNILLT